jgi:hypothetical protein
MLLKGNQALRPYTTVEILGVAAALRDSLD